MGMRIRGVVIGVVAVALCVVGPRADAACHAFTVSASPATISEGANVTVTVSRDGDDAPSDIHVETIDETARAPGDYARLDEQVQFTTETSKSFQLAILNDATNEGIESFRLHLSEPGGCPANTMYSVGADARVAIRASDPTPQPTQPQLTLPPAVTTAPPSSATPSPTPSPTPGASALASPTPSLFGTPIVGLDDGGAAFPVLPVVGLAVGLLAAGSGAWLLWFRQRNAL